VISERCRCAATAYVGTCQEEIADTGAAPTRASISSNALAQLQPFAALQRVIVGDDDLGVVVRVRQVLEEAFTLRFVRRHLGEPERRLRRFDLAEEGTDSRELVMSPVLE
jgi:hypothetical protein